jgi:hypothetical protein
MRASATITQKQSRTGCKPQNGNITGRTFSYLTAEYLLKGIWRGMDIADSLRGWLPGMIPVPSETG